MPLLRVHDTTVPLKGILFDKDGTLLDLMATWGSWAGRVLGRMEELLALSGAALSVDISRVLGTLHNEAGEVTGYDPAGPLPMATVEETHGLLAWQLYAAGMPWNEALTRVKGITAEAMNDIRLRRAAEPLPGLIRFLDSCAAAGLKLAVVTSDEAEAAEEHLEWLGIADRFAAVVTRECVANGKPAPDMALEACRRLGLGPGEVAVIGDSNGDMQMARAAGVLLAVGIRSAAGGGHLADADVLVDGFNELTLMQWLLITD